MSFISSASTISWPAASTTGRPPRTSPQRSFTKLSPILPPTNGAVPPSLPGFFPRNPASNALADQYKRGDPIVNPVLQVDISQNPDTHPDLSSPDLEAIDYHARLFRLVDHLPAVQRQVIRERFVEQRLIREIAHPPRAKRKAPHQTASIPRTPDTLRAQMEGGHA